MLIIRDFIKKYNGNAEPVLTIDHFEAAPGIYWIKGGNGSGKTTLLKSISGIIPFEGDITVDGHHCTKERKAYTQIVNYAEAEPVYPAFLNGKELINFYKSTKKGNFPDMLLKSLGVEKFMQQKTAVYSSGMIKKLSLVLAFTGKPALILLDEPLVALDISAVDSLQAAILQYKKAGVSFLITSHQPLGQELMDSVTHLVVTDKTLQPEIL